MADTIEIRYVDGLNTHTVNSLTAQKLLTATSAQVGQFFSANTTGTTLNKWNFDVFKRAADGTEVAIGSSQAIAEFTKTGAQAFGVQSSTWNCPGVDLLTTDAIHLVMRAQGIDIATKDAITDQVQTWAGVDKGRLQAAIWTFSRYLSATSSLTKHWYGNNSGEYYCRIENFTYGAAAAGPTYVNITDSGVGDDSSLAVAAVVAVYDNGTGTDAESITVTIALADSGVGTDVATGPNAPTEKILTDSGAGTDTITITATISVADSGTVTENLLIPNTGALLLVVGGFPPGQTVEYRLTNGDGTLLQSWTSSGVMEIPVSANTSRYRVWTQLVTNGVVDWRIPNTEYEAFEAINILQSNCDSPISTTASKVADLHDEAFGKWVLNPTAKTLTLYRADGTTVLKTFNLTDTTATVPTFIQRTPV